MTRTPGGQRRFDPADVEAYRARLSLPAPQAPTALAVSSKEVA